MQCNTQSIVAINFIINKSLSPILMTAIENKNIVMVNLMSERVWFSQNVLGSDFSLFISQWK